jgi:DNA-binding protein YbaB
MVSFSELRNSFKFQRQAGKVQKELKNIHVEAEASGVKVVVSGVAQDRIAPLLTDALNRALKKAQIVSAERMQSVMGDLGLGVKN